MTREFRDREIPLRIKDLVARISPKGYSTVALSKYFHGILERIAIGLSPEQVSDWTESHTKGKRVTASAINKYIEGHEPSIYDIELDVSEQIVASGVDAVSELQKMFEEICIREEEYKIQIKEKGWTWTETLGKIQKQKKEILESFNKAKSEKKRFDLLEKQKSQEQSSEDQKNKWSPEFARMVSSLITQQMSKNEGVLRKFQPKTIEDRE